MILFNGILTLLAELYHVVETLDVDPDRQGHVVLSHGGEEGGEVDQPVDPLVDHDLLQTLEVQHVSEHKRPWSVSDLME